jgi:hypothetical protein
MDMRSIRREWHGFAFALCATLVCLSATGQTITPRVSGTFALAPTGQFAGIQGSFTCTGAPTCTGQFSIVIHDPLYCTNDLPNGRTTILKRHRF